MTREAASLYATARQRASDDPYKALPERLHKAREALMSQLRPIFLANELTDQQWRVLRVLSAVESIDSAGLARRALLLGPSLSRILKDLEGRKFVAKAICVEDGRRTLHRITPAGRERIGTTAPRLTPLFDRLRDRIPPHEVARLNDLLDAVIAALDGD